VLVDRRWTELLQEQLVELNGLLNRVLAAADALRICFAVTDEGILVRWLERRSQAGGDANVVARAAPIDLSDVLRDALFDRVDTAILTSATLATRDGFGFVRQRLGVGAGLRVREEVHESPFDFETQAMVAIPTDLPVPGAGENQEFDRAVADVVSDVASTTKGGVFVLFTSYRSLRSVAAELRRQRVHERWPLYVQGEGARSRLLESFVGSGSAILLGVASFWEGVDVPGDPLRGIVIAKLPFKVPTEPLTAARIEAIERAGGGSFIRYLLPHAALRLKQGFGRLIRTRTDRGVVVLLDRRILERGTVGTSSSPSHQRLYKRVPGPNCGSSWHSSTVSNESPHWLDLPVCGRLCNPNENPQPKQNRLRWPQLRRSCARARQRRARAPADFLKPPSSRSETTTRSFSHLTPSGSIMKARLV
jgi:ATP-dependent DNA helicase DinG